MSSSDYSVQQSDDRAGPGQAACALDVSLNQSDMKTVTQRLITAVNNGEGASSAGRLWTLREFFGTTNGTEVTGRDVRTGNWVTSDDSHL